MSPLARTYQQKRGPEVPSFSDYADRISAEYAALLAQDPQESELQKFLEQNPSMVPGSRTPCGTSGHWPLHMAVISQPPLHGFNGHIPDFMWLSKHSDNWYPAMVEIERPAKRLFTAAKRPTADFTQARNQLAEWKTWLKEPTNQLKFVADYGVAPSAAGFYQMGYHFLLVYGRRAEFETDQELTKLRSNLLGDDEDLMSFDRLCPDESRKLAVTVKATGSGKFKVIAVPETFGLRPANAKHLSSYTGLEEAIDANPNISQERAAFLRERIGYWCDWCKAGKIGVTGNEFVE
ncbi:Shedu immune nuclease family protein [Anatilimnocola floriformis]|uniref:Shedu immune nuclease family protein n=1 Tax=Anatilimnocola floriformis TaxID=2948575 RepID=UPI0020C34E48|nr:Shedu immune nuclease family protein [Anatilimnocola floriformis]